MIQYENRVQQSSLPKDLKFVLQSYSRSAPTAYLCLSLLQIYAPPCQPYSTAKRQQLLPSRLLAIKVYQADVTETEQSNDLEG